MAVTNNQAILTKDEFELDFVYGHITNDKGQTWYRVKYTGYPDYNNALLREDIVPEELVTKYKESERYKNGCPVILDYMESGETKQDYTSNRNLYKVKAGLISHKDRINGEDPNFNSQDQILAAVRKFHRTHATYKKFNPIIEEFIGQPLEQSKSYLMTKVADGHMYAIAIHKQKVYIGDGVNYIATREPAARKVVSKLASRLKIRPRAINFLNYNYQEYDNHCGSSCALILVELLRLMYTDTDDLNRLSIMPNTTLRSKFKKELHPFGVTDEKLPPRGRSTLEERVGSTTCRYCNKRKGDRRRCRQHEAKCPMKPINMEVDENTPPEE